MHRVRRVVILLVVIVLAIIVHTSFAQSAGHHFGSLISKWSSWPGFANYPFNLTGEMKFLLAYAVIPALATVTWLSIPLMCLREHPVVLVTSSVLSSLCGQYIVFHDTVQKLQIVSYVGFLLWDVLTAVGMAMLFAWIMYRQTTRGLVVANMNMICRVDGSVPAHRGRTHPIDGFLPGRSRSLWVMSFLVRTIASAGLIILGICVYWIVMDWGAWITFYRIFDGIVNWDDSDIPRPWALVNTVTVALLVIIPSAIAATFVAIPLMWLRAHAFVVAGVVAVLPATALFTSRLLQGLPVHEGDGLLFYVSSILMGAILGVGFGSLCLERVVEENITQKSDLCGSM